MQLKQTREAHGLSQKELAARMGVSQPTVCDWESGKKSPTKKNLEKLCRLFDCSSDYLLFGDRERPATDEEVKFALFGSASVDDELYEEVKRFAQYAKQKRDEETR